jgi:hypothetical protein
MPEIVIVILIYHRHTRIGLNSYHGLIRTQLANISIHLLESSSYLFLLSLAKSYFVLGRTSDSTKVGSSHISLRLWGNFRLALGHMCSVSLHWPPCNPVLPTCINSLWGYMKKIVPRLRDKATARLEKQSGLPSFSHPIKCYRNLRTWRRIILFYEN